MWFVYLLIFAAGFAAGWAFDKHRIRLKEKAYAEGMAAKKAIQDAEDQALNLARPTRTPRG